MRQGNYRGCHDFVVQLALPGASLPALTSVHLQLGSLYERKQDRTAAVKEYQLVLKTDAANAKARSALERLGRE